MPMSAESSAIAKEHHENLGEQEPAEDFRSELRRQIGFVNPSSTYLKLCGTLAFSHQLTTVSAQAVCPASVRVTKTFDLLGLISVFRTVAATKSLSYSALNESSFFLTGHVGPGSLRVASSLLKAACSTQAFGASGFACDLFQLDCPRRLHYIGLKSNTESPVGNAVGASIVRESRALWKETNRKAFWAMTERRGKTGVMEAEGRGKPGRRVGRDAKRNVKVIVLEVGLTGDDNDWQDKELRVSLKSSRRNAWLLGWLPLLLTLGVIANCISCNQTIAAGLILLGTLGMMISVMGLRLCLFTHCKPRVAEGAPPGDCLIVDEADADTLHVVVGEEESIQALFQRKVLAQRSLLAKYMLLTAGFILCVYVIGSVFYMPNISLSGQIHFAIANLIGFAADMMKAYQNGKLGLAKRAAEQFKIVVKDVVVFRNRTAAVAFVAKHAKDPTMLKSKKLLPYEGAVWQKWWEILGKWDGEVDALNDSTKMKRALATVDSKDQPLLQVLLHDMVDGITA